MHRLTWNAATDGTLCRGLAAVKRCSRVYLEAYTSVLLCDKSKLVSLGGGDECVTRGLGLSVGV